MFPRACLIALLVLVSRKAVGTNDAAKCVTPTNLDGLCVPISSCSSIVKTLTQYGFNIPAEEKTFIQRSFCGEHSGAKYVCCPKDDVTFNSVGLELLRNVSCGYFDLPRVAHGQEAVLFTFPWMALLKYEDEQPFKCGGTLISARYVLTAAHCVVGIRYPLVEVRLGEHNISSTQDCQYFGNKLVCADPVEDIGVEQIIQHPGYKRSNIQHDIALVRLNRTVEFKRHIRPICLPLTQKLIETVPENYFVSGWGYTETGTTSDVLMWASIPHREQSECMKVFRGITLIPGQICVGGTNNQDSCRGDSGGPLAQVGLYQRKLKLIQFGIVSYGVASCGDKNLPAVYTNVSQYMEWIINNLRV